MNNSELPLTTPAETPREDTGPEDRLNEAVLALLRARDAGDARQVQAILDQYDDLREPLRELLELEAYFGMDHPSADPLGALAEEVAYRKYDSWEERSSGAYGMVFKARDRVLGRPVAIKLFKPDLSNTSALTRFLEEPQVASQLDHPGVAPVHELGRMPDGRPYVAMKWVDGQTLAELLREKRSPADRPRLLVIFKQICQTVAYAHQVRGVLHRDLKPANIMVGSFGEVFVLDWGLSKVLLAPEEGTANEERIPVETVRTLNPQMMTQDGARIGTWAYMSPEQAGGKAARITSRSDVFGLGAILCEILTGSPPYRRREQLEETDLTDAHARLEASGSDPELIALAKTCLAPRPEDRLADAGMVADWITAHLDGVQAREQREAVENAGLRARLSAFRWRVIAGFVLGAAVLTLLAAAAWNKFERDALRAAEHTRLTLRKEDVLDRLNQVEAALREDRRGDAQAALGAVQGRLAEGGLDALQERARSAQRDLTFLDQLERLRQEHITSSEGMGFGEPDATLLCTRVFREYGIELDDRETAVRTIRGSPIRAQLLAALDHGVLSEPPISPWRRKLLLVAQAASDSEWGRRFRDPELNRNPAALAGLARQTSPEQCTPVEIESLAKALESMRKDAEPLLRRGLMLYPSDFWLNLRLAMTLQSRAQQLGRTEQARKGHEEAVGYLRAALAVRPRSLYARVLLGLALGECGRYGEAVSALKWAIQEQIKQSSLERSGLMIGTHYALARAQMYKGDMQEAENTCNEALRLAPNLKPLVELRKEILRRKAQP